MFPINPHIGSLIIPSHLVLDVIAFYTAFKYYFYLSNKRLDQISDRNRSVIILGALAGALIGSRLLAALERPDLFFHPSSFLFYIADQTVAGGIIGAILGTELTKKIIGERKSSGDIYVFPLIIGMMIGRVGCFLTGVSDGTVGIPSTLPWALDQGDGLRRHPTSLYEIVFLGILFIFLHELERRKKLKSGILFRMFIIGYLLFRFFIEFIKPIQQIAFHLSAIQIASFLIASYYLVQLGFRKKSA